MWVIARTGGAGGLIPYRADMTRTNVAWLLAALCVAAAVVAAIVQPLHWERTAALAVLLGLVAVVYGFISARSRGSGP